MEKIWEPADLAPTFPVAICWIRWRRHHEDPWSGWIHRHHVLDEDLVEKTTSRQRPRRRRGCWFLPRHHDRLAARRPPLSSPLATTPWPQDLLPQSISLADMPTRASNRAAAGEPKRRRRNGRLSRGGEERLAVGRRGSWGGGWDGGARGEEEKAGGG